MRLQLFLIPHALCQCQALELHHGSFLQAGRLLSGVARPAARASARAPEAHQLLQRPQSRIMRRGQPASPPRAMISGRGASRQGATFPPRSQDRSGPQFMQQPDSFQRDARASTALQPTRVGEKAYSGAAGQDSKRTMQPSLPCIEGGRQIRVPLPKSTEALQALPPPPVALDPEAAMGELATAAGSIAAETQLSANRPVPPEARESLTALRYLTLPQLDTQAVEIPFKIIFAEIATPGEKQVQVKRVTASMTRFVGETAHVAVFEVQASDPLFARLLHGPHHLRLGYSPLAWDQVSNNPTAVLNAAIEGGKPTKASLSVLEKCMKRGFANAFEASESTALLLPIYVAEIPRFDQKFAWVGGKVFSPTATLSPPFVCALEGLMRPPTSTAPSGVKPSSQVSTQLPHLSVAAREFAAHRVLTAVCNLHSLGIVHGDLSLESIVVTREGNVFVSALESARFVSLNTSCSSSLPEAINTARDLQADQSSKAKELAPSEAAAATGELSMAVQPISNPSDTHSGCLSDSEQQLAHESVNVGVVLFQILSGGGLPFGVPEGGDVAEAVKALHEGLLRPNKFLPRATMELQKLGVSEKWQACVHALLNVQQRQTAMQAAASYFPEAFAPGNSSHTEARG